MHISWQGFNYFRLQNNQITILFNPYAWDDSTTFSKVKADLVLFSDPKHFAANKVSEQAFIISSPGEYEIKDVFVYGQQLNGANIFLLSFEDVKIAFLGEFGHQALTTKDLELIEGCDILILPIGGGELTSAKEAVKIIHQVEPRVVIPSAFAGSVGKLSADPLDLFLKEFGVKAQEEEKFKLTKKDLPQEDIKLVVLKAQK